MKIINELTSEPNQNHVLTLADGTTISITFNYRVNQQGWFISFIYGTLSFNNRRIVNSPNMLRQFRNVIPFGFACTVVNGEEPIFQNDFENKRANFYLLNSEDVEYVEENIINV